MAEPVIPSSAEDVVHNVALRQLVDDNKTTLDDEQSPLVLAVMRRVLDAVRDGVVPEGFKAEIQRYTAGNAELAQVLGAMFIRLQSERFIDFLEVQDKLERFLRRCMKRGDLTPAEALVFLNMAKNEIKSVGEGLHEVIKAGASETDGEMMLSKIDCSPKNTLNGRDYTKTTPQGREIVRKLIRRARKKMGIPEK